MSCCVPHREDGDALRRRLKDFLEHQRSDRSDRRCRKIPRLSKLAEKYRDGVRIASPVFDGAAEEEIFNLLRKRDCQRLAR